MNVTVTPVDDAPTALTLSNDSVDENKPVGTVVGTFSTVDIDSSSFTYSFVDGTNDNASFTIDSNALKTAESFDFETKKSYSIEVQSKDAQGKMLTETFTVSVNNVNEAPLLTIDAPADGAEFTTNDTVTLTATAVDPEDGNISSKVIWTSDLDGELDTGASVDVQLSAGNHTLTASVTDVGGKTQTKSVSVRVTGLTAWQFGTGSDDYARSVATDSDGNVYVAGFTEGSLPGNTSVGASDASIAKYGKSGTQLWVEQFGTSGLDIASGVATDSSGNIYISGYTSESLPGNTNAGSSAYDAFIAKYDSSGAQLWVEQFGTSTYDWAQSVATDSSGNVYIAGSTFGSLPGNSNAGGEDGGEDIFVAKYSSSGTQLWVKQFGSYTYDGAFSVATDAGGNVYVSGYTEGSLPGNSNSYEGEGDSFIAKYSSSGTRLWVKQFDGSYYDQATGVTTDSNGSVYVVGYSLNHSEALPPPVETNMFLAKYDGNGTQLWLKRFGAFDSDYAEGYAQDVTIDHSNNIYIAGNYSGVATSLKSVWNASQHERNDLSSSEMASKLPQNAVFSSSIPS